MKNVLVLLAACVVTLGGCATVPPPKITNTAYENYDFEFYIEIPDGWEHANLEDCKKVFKASSPWFGAEMIAFFMNQSSEQSMIAIAGNRSFLDPALLSFMRKSQLVEIYKDQFAQRQSAFNSKEMTADCKQDIIGGYSRTAPSHTYDVTCDLLPLQEGQDALKLVTKDYFYKCHEDDTCNLRLVLVSNVTDYDDNLADLETMSKALRHVLPPVPQETASN